MLATVFANASNAYDRLIDNSAESSDPYRLNAREWMDCQHILNARPFGPESLWLDDVFGWSVHDFNAHTLTDRMTAVCLLHS